MDRCTAGLHFIYIVELERARAQQVWAHFGSPLLPKQDTPKNVTFLLSTLDLAKEENMLPFVCSEAVEFNLFELEISHTVIIPPTVSVLCPYNRASQMFAKRAVLM